MNMKPDPLDAFFHSNDPAAPAQQSVHSAADPILQDSRRQWDSLHSRRIRVRRRMVFAMAALALFVATGSLVFNVQQDDSIKGSPIVLNESNESSSAALSPPIAVIESASDDRPEMRDKQHVIDVATAAVTPLDEFVAFVQQAGSVNSATWIRSRDRLAASGERSQRNAIQAVPQLGDTDLRSKAFQLVSEAAGPAEIVLLNQWLAEPSVRSLAWDRLLSSASPEQTIQMITLARHEQEREQLCGIIAGSSHPHTVRWLIELAMDSRWRFAAGNSMHRLNPAHVEPLIMSMRQRDPHVRTAAGFLLASIPGEQLDEVAAAMILSGRHRQPAYLVLLSRNTPSARSFLLQAATRADLNPALVSAQLHFANIQELLQQWIVESKGNHYAPLHQSNRVLPEIIVDRHLAGRHTHDVGNS